LCYFLKYWAGLYKEEVAVKIREGSQKMVKKAAALARDLQQSFNQATILMIEGP
jgi:hypothetical protein